jgi:transcriptional regulator with XRE-family HTH domain
MRSLERHNAKSNALHWKLRRIASDLRQQDVANRVGISATRYSGIERGEVTPTDLERQLLDVNLPPLSLPAVVSPCGDINSDTSECLRSLRAESAE